MLLKPIKIHVDTYRFYRRLDCYVFFFGDVFSVFIPNSEHKVNPLDKLISGDTVPPLCLPATAQVVRLVPVSSVPKSEDQITKEDEDPYHLRAQSPLGYMEVADVARR